MFPTPLELPNYVNLPKIVEYLERLKTSGADSALILFTDEEGKTKEIARYDKDNASSVEPKIHIQSSTKAIFMLYLLDTMGEALWNKIEEPVGELIRNKNLFASFLKIYWTADGDDKIRQDPSYVRPLVPDSHFEELGAKVGKLSLRQLVNHASGIPFFESDLFDPEGGVSPREFTRYSNTAVEIAAAVLHQWLREQPGNERIDVVDHANGFLERKFKDKDIKFGVYEKSAAGFVHVLGSGKINATVSWLSQLSTVVRTLEPLMIEKVFTPISTYNPNLASGIGEFKELNSEGAKLFWGEDLNPTSIANLFFIRAYGYGTRGSIENNCDVVIKDFPSSGSPSDRAAAIQKNPHFTVVRLQAEWGVHPADHGSELQKILGSFFVPALPSPNAA